MSAAAENVVDRLADVPEARRGTGVAAWPAVLACAAATFVGLAPTFGYLVPAWWNSETYSHGLLVAPICIWLLWRQRHAIPTTPVAPSASALAMLAGAVFLWMMANAASVQVGVENLFPLAVGLGIVAALGWRVGARIAFPVGFLYFATSVWDVINGALQSLTTRVVSVILELVGVPAFIEGNAVQIPSGWFEIAGGCSGLHFFIVAGALAALYGHLHYRRWRNRVLLLITGFSMALLANWIRVASIIVVGHLTEMQHYLVQVDHYVFGWIVFAVGLLPFFAVARHLEGGQPHAPNDRHRDGPAPNAPCAVPASRLVADLGLLLLPALTWSRAEVVPSGPVSVDLPAVDGWRGPAAPAARWTPVFSGAWGEERASYRRDGQIIDVYVNWYLHQAPGRELIAYGNHIEGATSWRVASRQFHTPSADERGAARLQETVLQSQRHGQRLIWSWYVVGDTRLASPLRAKLLEAWRTLTGRDGAGMVALSIDCAGPCETARPAVAAAARDLGAPLSAVYSAAAPD
jgi:exosortase A